jgi:hypothetical protein
MKPRRIHSLAALGVLVIVCSGLLAADLQCQPAEARPSLAALQEQVDALTDAVCLIADAQGLTPPSVCRSYRIVFLSSEEYTGNLGGLEGADQICTDLALEAGLVGNFKAWLARGTDENPASRFVRSAEPYVLVDGTQIALDWDDLTDGEILAPINVDENGAHHSLDLVWTSAAADGTSSGYQDCSGWTIEQPLPDSGGLGLNTETDFHWTEQVGRACDETYALYCFEQ